MTDWPSRSQQRTSQQRVMRVSKQAVKRLPVTASSPKIIPQPTLVPRTRLDALAATVVYVATLILLFALVTYSVMRLQAVALAGKLFVGTIIAFTSITIILFIIGLGLYVLPVLFGVRRPAPIPPPTWPGIGDRH